MRLTPQSATTIFTSILSAASFSCDSRPKEISWKEAVTPPSIKAISVKFNDPKERLSSALRDPITKEEMRWAHYRTSSGNLYVGRFKNTITFGDEQFHYYYREGIFQYGNIVTTAIDSDGCIFISGIQELPEGDQGIRFMRFMVKENLIKMKSWNREDLPENVK